MEIILITGPINSGKSSAMMKLVLQEKAAGFFPTGIIARAVIEHDRKIGFDIIDLLSDEIKPLARLNWNISDSFKVGKYLFAREGFEFARKALLNFHTDGVVFLDEAGPLELDDCGYADCLRQLIDSNIRKLYIAVREECVTELREKFFLGKNVKILNIKNLNEK
jgi:nucleoside-triphosphatase THEP1